MRPSPSLSTQSPHSKTCDWQCLITQPAVPPVPDVVSLLHDNAARGLKSTVHTKAVATVRMASPRFVLGDCSIDRRVAKPWCLSTHADLGANESHETRNQLRAAVSSEIATFGVL